MNIRNKRVFVYVTVDNKGTVRSTTNITELQADLYWMYEHKAKYVDIITVERTGKEKWEQTDKHRYLFRELKQLFS